MQQPLKDWGKLKNLKLNQSRFIEKKNKKNKKKLRILVIGLLIEGANFTRGVFSTHSNIYDRLFFQGSPEAIVHRCSLKKGVIKKFANFTGKHLCWSLT